MSANIELVTSHQGSPHITVDQVRDLFAGLSGDITGVKIFQNLDDAFSITIESTTSIRIGTGQSLAGGFFFQLLDSYLLELDPGLVGYSRIDSLYVVIYEDDETLVQTADFVYQAGELYPNGTTGTVPAAPSGENVKESFEFLRMFSKDGALVAIEEKYTNYISNGSLSSDLNGFRFGVDSDGNYGYYKAGADTVTPFRDPQGNATADDVRKGKTFANAENDEIEGNMRVYEQIEINIKYSDIHLPYTYTYYPLGYVDEIRIEIDN